MLIKAETKLDTEILVETEKNDQPEWLNDRKDFKEMNVIGSEEGSFKAKKDLSELEEMFK